jgi:hypothetical protein
MPPGRAISLFLIDGVPEGRVSCELFNWTGKAYKIPRRMLKESADRSALLKAGVYFLFGRDEGQNHVQGREPLRPRRRLRRDRGRRVGGRHGVGRRGGRSPSRVILGPRIAANTPSTSLRPATGQGAVAPAPQ